VWPQDTGELQLSVNFLPNAVSGAFAARLAEAFARALTESPLQMPLASSHRPDVPTT
jgi:hypothetical protein